jgi:hypothetical protein
MVSMEEWTYKLLTELVCSWLLITVLTYRRGK